MPGDQGKPGKHRDRPTIWNRPAWAHMFVWPHSLMAGHPNQDREPEGKCPPIHPVCHSSGNDSEPYPAVMLLDFNASVAIYYATWASYGNSPGLSFLIWEMGQQIKHTNLLDRSVCGQDRVIHRPIDTENELLAAKGAGVGWGGGTWIKQGREYSRWPVVSQQGLGK